MNGSKKLVTKLSFQKKFRATTLSIAIMATLGSTTMPAQAAIPLYMDTTTQQVFTAPGTNRVLLSEFEAVNEVMGKASPQEIKILETRLRQQKKKAELAAAEELAVALAPKKSWSDTISIGGYTQFRYAEPISGDPNSKLSSPGDRYIGPNTGFGIRRGRVRIAGDINDQIYIYTQVDLASTISTDGKSADQAHYTQVRDLYADIAFDDQKEFRVRAGSSKIPYGFEILQSSQNRIGFDRADAVNIATRDERDLGLVFMWAPSEIRDRFRDLVRLGLKGSGDYGVIALAVMNGQGVNRSEKNENREVVVRVSYPYKFDDGQYFEAGISALSGKYNPTTKAYTPAGGTAITPTLSKVDKIKGLQDDRVGLHAVLYPQPFGLQAEYNWGHSPTLSAAGTTIESASLKGGYVQAMYKLDNAYGSWMPYIKFQTYDGSEKFSTNAPRSHLRELETGVEWLISQQLELTVAYANMDRSNLSNYTAPGTVLQVRADMVRVQLQWNF